MMNKVLVFGMTDNPGGMESVIMNYYRHIDRSVLQFEFLCNTEKVAYEDEIRGLGGVIHNICARSKNLKQYKHDMKDFFENNADKYCALWFNTCSLSNIDYLLYAKKNHIPKRIIHCHNAANGGDSFLRNLLHKYHQRKVFKYATDFWTCNQDSDLWFFGKSSKELPNYRVIYNAIDLDYFAPNDEIRKKYRSKLNISNEILLGHDGRFHYQKNQEFLIKVMRELNQRYPNKYKLILIGQGENMKMIQDMINEYNLQNSVILPGVVSNVNDYLQAMDIFCFPSRFEGLGLSLVEAEANGLPCVISNTIPKEAVVNKAVDALGIEDNDISEWVESIETFSKINKSLNREDFINNHYDIDLEAKVVQDILLQND